MKYKLLVVDMDGTLLNSSKKVSHETRQVLEELKNIGVNIAIATGRIYTTVKAYAKDLKIEAPIIACNGAVIKDINNNKTIYSNHISEENCYRILEICKRYGTNCYLYSEDTIFAEKLEKLGKYFIKMSKTQKEEDKIKVEMVNDSREVVSRGEKIYKFVIFSDDSKSVEFAKEEILKSLDLEVYKSTSDFLDVVNKGVCKGSGIRNLANIFDIETEEIIAVGDNENDISMIKYAGLGIAMGNGVDEIKKVADYITDTNDNDGLAKALRKFVLEGSICYEIDTAL